jgi:hypothetical protein
LAKAYIPIKSVRSDYPTSLEFVNGVRIIDREGFAAADLNHWEQVFSRQELKEIEEWHLALACEWGAGESQQWGQTPEVRLANTRLALQVAAPVGTFLSVAIRLPADGTIAGAVATRWDKFRGTAWSRMRGFGGLTKEEILAVVDGTLNVIKGQNPRTVTPFRLLEQGLISSDPYIRIFMWTTALDSILMAVKEQIFVDRLCALLGPDRLVFPPQDGVYIPRGTKVSDVAGDLFTLRSLLAHGRVIDKRFWEERPDLKDILHPSVYNPPLRYRVLLEEAALSLLTFMLQRVILHNALGEFSVAKKWAARVTLNQTL